MGAVKVVVMARIRGLVTVSVGAVVALACILVPLAAGQLPTWGADHMISDDTPASSPSSVTLAPAGAEVAGTQDPWGMAQLPDGSWLVTSRSGERIMRVADGQATELAGPGMRVIRSFVENPPERPAPDTPPVPEPDPDGAPPDPVSTDSVNTDPASPDPASTAPASTSPARPDAGAPSGDSSSSAVSDAPVTPPDEAGLYGIAVSPTFAEDSSVFLFASNGVTSRIYRLTLSGTEVTQARGILGEIPAGAGKNGGALAFGPDSYLYASVGDAGEPRLAGDLDSMNGKILRLGADGSAPPTNPLTSSVIWSAGHRNVTAMAWNAAGVMFAVEPGGDYADELNVILPGHNYGWPDLEGEGGASAGYTDPAVQWLRTDSHTVDPAGLAINDGALYVASYSGERIWRYQLTTQGFGQVQSLVVGQEGRFGAISITRDGGLAVLTANSATRAAHTIVEPYDLLPVTLPEDATDEEKQAAQEAAQERATLLKAPDRIVTFTITP